LTPDASEDGPDGPIGAVPRPLGLDPNPGLWITFLYGIYDALWILVLLCFSPWWVLRCLRDPNFRRMARERMTLPLPGVPARSFKRAEWPAGSRQRVLVHGVSVGEIKASQSLVEALRVDYEVVVSASTNTGMEVARQLYPELYVVRFPLDLYLVVRRFLNRVRPDWVILMELEIWPNFLKKANRMGCPVAVVSGRITESSVDNYKRFGATLPQFNRITLFAAQNERYAERFTGLAGSAQRVMVTGNVKVDGLRTGAPPRDAAFERLQTLAGPRPGQPVLVAGSTHDPEEGLICGAFRKACPQARIIIVPRHPPRAEQVVADLAAQGERAQRWTDLLSGAESVDPDRPLVVDTIGELERIYGLATLVFVGGTLVPHGGQNMLEPAAQGLPVLYGPSTENFTQEAALLEEAGAGLRVQDAGELAQKIQGLLADEDLRETMARAGVQAVVGQRGATERTLLALRERCGLD
jgi:3-deoxy-D-manno-octulosonic-acid transferase